MPMPPFHPYKVSAVHTVHLALKARWSESDDWRIPVSYGDPEGEARSASAAVGLQDISDCGKLDLKGSEVETALNTLSNVTISVLRIKPRHALVVTPRNATASLHQDLLVASTSPSGCLHVTDVSSALAAFVVVGPRADAVLSELTALDLRLKRFPEKSCAQTDLAKVHATIVRNAWGALPAYVVLVGRDVGEYAWAAISAAGAKWNLTPIGTAAAQLMYGRLVSKAGAAVEEADPKNPILNPA